MEWDQIIPIKMDETEQLECADTQKPAKNRKQ